MGLTIDQTLQRGISAHKEGKLQDAGRLYRAILQSQPFHPEANHNLGIIAVSVDKASVALPLFKTAVEANPKIEQFWLSYIDALIKEKQFHNAQQVLQQAKKQGMTGHKFNALDEHLELVSLGSTSTFSNQITSERNTRTHNVDHFHRPEEKLKSLLEYYKNGQLDDAEELAVSITQDFPSHQFGWKVLGALLKQTGRTVNSLTATKKSVQLTPQDPSALNTLGLTFYELGRLDEAETIYMQAIALKPDYADAHFNLADAFKEVKRLDDAGVRYKKAIVLKPVYAEAYNNLGNMFQQLGSLDDAKDIYTKAVVLKPEHAEAYNNLGGAFTGLGSLDKAEVIYRQAIVLAPNFAEAHNNLGNTAERLGKLNDAAVYRNQATELKPDFAIAHNNLGVALHALGKLEKAEARYKKAMVLVPGFAEALCSFGKTLLLKNRFEQAFKFNEWRWQTTQKIGKPLNSKKPSWCGFAKQNVFVWREQGIGDQIMFSSMIPELNAKAESLILECDKRLIPIFQRSLPDDIKYISNRLEVSETDYDSHIPIGSLPRYFRPNLASFRESSSGWLRADSQKVDEIRKKIVRQKKGKIVGISWLTKSILPQASHRGIRLDQLANALNRFEVALVNLQYGDVSGEITSLRRDHGINLLEIPNLNLFDDVDGLAAAISACDFVVSIDNSTVHLAGALGVDARVLLPHVANERWGLGTTNSYWYKSITLYRQTKRGDWLEALERLINDFENKL